MRLSGLAICRGDVAVVLTNVDQTFGSRIGPRLRRIGASVAVRPWVDIDAASGRLVPEGSIGLGARSSSALPAIVALVVPQSVAALDTADRLLMLQRTHVLRLEMADVRAAFSWLGSVRTESVDDYAVSRAAESIREILAEFTRAPTARAPSSG